VRRPPLAFGAAAAYVAFLFHAGADWDWELPAVTLAALFTGVALLAAARGDGARPLGGRARAWSLAGLLVLAAFGLVGFVGNAYLASGQDALDASRPALAQEKARAAARWAPWSSAPWSLLGQAQLTIGNLGPARQSFRKALENDPGNWDVWLNLALASEGPERERALAEANRLNPLSEEIAEIEAGAQA